MGSCCRGGGAVGQGPRVDILGSTLWMGNAMIATGRDCHFRMISRSHFFKMATGYIVPLSLPDIVTSLTIGLYSSQFVLLCVIIFQMWNNSPNLPTFGPIEHSKAHNRR